MNWEWTPHTLFGAVAGITAFLSAGYIWYRYRFRTAARMGGMLMFAVGWWLIGNLLEVSSATFNNRLFWDKIQFMGIVALPPGWVTYTMRFIGNTSKISLRRFMLLWFIPSVTIVLVFTNEFHGFIWADYKLEMVDGIVVKTLAYGPGFWLFIVHAYISVFAGLAILMKAMLDFGRLYRWQASLLFVVVLFPWFVNVLTIGLGWRPLWGLDLTPAALALTISVAGWMLLRLEIRDLSPVARHLVIDQMRDGVLVLNAEHLIMDLNPAALHLLQRQKRELLGRPIMEFWPDWSDGLLAVNDHVGTAVEWTWGESEQRTFDVQLSPLFDGRNRLVSRIIVLRDIAERKKMEAQLKASLNEKEVLLQEVHHRVKNNLQIISSLLNLQAVQAQDDQVVEALQEGQNRVRSMALIHETLYRSGDLSRVDFGKYVRRLAEQLYQTYRMLPDQVTMSVETDEIFLTMETAVPCGLILNELISNALKHAFVDGRLGQIAIRLQNTNDNGYHLTVNDNGIGLPTHINLHNTDTLGLQLVNTLVYQLQGSLAITNEQGTSISVTFAEKPSRETS